MTPATGAGRGWAAGLDAAPLPLRPRGVGDLIDAAVELLRGRFWIYLGLTALILAPVRVAGYYAQDRLMLSGEPDFGDLAVFMGAAMVLPMLVQSLVTALVIVIVHGQLLGRSTGAGEALARTLRRLPALVLLLLLMSTIVVGLVVVPMVLLVLSVICIPLLPLTLALLVYLGWKLYLATPALVLEGLGPLAAIRRSFGLSAGSFWRWLGVYAVAWLLALFFGALAQAADDPSVRRPVLEFLGAPRALFDAVYLPVSTLLSALAISFTAVVATAFYVDARMRREGFDLELRLERLRGARSTA